jgi:uncharacterized protein
MFGLDKNTISKINSVFSKYSQIEKVILYGSRAMGNYKPGSDIDIAVVGKDLNLSLIHEIEVKIDDLLLPYTFDISIFNQISNEDLLDHIKNHGKLFYERKNEDVK